MMYKKILTFSFDDGVTQDIRFIELLDKYGLKCTFNLNSDKLGADETLVINNQPVSHKKVLSEQVKDIYKNHEVASHTLTHPFLTTLEPSEVTRQVECDRQKLSELVGYEVVGFAYPGGGVNFNENVAHTIKTTTGVKYARTIVPSNNFDLPDDMFTFSPTASFCKDFEEVKSLSQKFLNLNTDEVKLLYLWGHSYELDINDGWKKAEEIFRMLSGREDILYCTNTEAFSYLKKIR